MLVLPQRSSLLLLLCHVPAHFFTFFLLLSLMSPAKLVGTESPKCRVSSPRRRSGGTVVAWSCALQQPTTSQQGQGQGQPACVIPGDTGLLWTQRQFLKEGSCCFGHSEPFSLVSAGALITGNKPSDPQPPGQC
jgi:hypothetical protein